MTKQHRLIHVGVPEGWIRRGWAPVGLQLQWAECVEWNILGSHEFPKQGSKKVSQE
jgi:hypothetical protein